MDEYGPNALRDYQVQALEALRQSVGQGIRRIVLSSPTGSGKTKIAAAVVDGAIRKGNRMAFVVNAISLIDQTMEMFNAEGITDIGVIQANHVMTDWSKPCQICSIQTLQKRDRFPDANVVVFDECHVLYEHHKTWLEHSDWQKVPFIGLSATPYTKGLGKFFETLLVVSTTKEMIDRGWLSPFRVFATGHPDLTGVKTIADDYHEGQLSEAMQKGTLTADIISTWQRHWGKDKTLCFAVDRAHAKALQERFLQSGITCGYQDANTPMDERREIKRNFHNGEFQVVTNVGTMTTGVDFDVRCLILARPTKSEILYQQIIGRSLRTAEGKPHALILDHSDTTLRLGFVTDIHHDMLDDGKPKVEAERKPPLPRECKQCGILKPPRTSTCPNCGFKGQVVSSIHEDDGELVEVTAGVKPKAPKRLSSVASFPDKEVTSAMLKGYALEHGYKPGWAAMKYKELYGVWPVGAPRYVQPQMPNVALRSWIKSTMIRWANSKRKSEGYAWGRKQRDEQIIDHVREQYASPQPETLMTAADWDEFR